MCPNFLVGRRSQFTLMLMKLKLQGPSSQAISLLLIHHLVLFFTPPSPSPQTQFCPWNLQRAFCEGPSHVTLYLEPAAAAAKSLQSCPTLRDPIDGSPPGSSDSGILQARILEWVAISFSNLEPAGNNFLVLTSKHQKVWSQKSQVSSLWAFPP